MDNSSYEYIDLDSSERSHLDKVEDILLMSNNLEMENRINKNCNVVLYTFKSYLKKLQTNKTIYKEDNSNLFACLKFLDSLNLFMPNETISKLLSLISSIDDITYNNELIANKIKYTKTNHN